MPTAGGVRTATEVQRLSQLGSQRLGVLSRVLSATTIRPMVRMMVANIQDSLSLSGSINIDGQNMPNQLASMVEDGYLDYDVSKDLQGNIDYLVIDGTLPLEPTRNAETWMNMLHHAADRPQHGIQRWPDCRRGHPRDGHHRPRPLPRQPRDMAQNGPSPSQQLAIMEKMRGASVQPAEQVDREVERGNLIPMSEARRDNG